MRKSLFHLSLIGKSSLSLLEDVESVKSFLNDFIKNGKFIQFGNCFFISYDEDVIEISNNLKRHFDDEIAFVVLDITQNMNIFDFVGYINENHESSKEFVELIKEFAENNGDNEEQKELNDEELLKMAIDNEDFEEAAKIRDRMQLNLEEN
jgi:spermidine/putrescine-binding protein